MAAATVKKKTGSLCSRRLGRLVQMECTAKVIRKFGTASVLRRFFPGTVPGTEVDGAEDHDLVAASRSRQGKCIHSISGLSEAD